MLKCCLLLLLPELEVDILLRVIKTRRCGMCFLCLFRKEQCEATIYNYVEPRKCNTNSGIILQKHDVRK